MRRSPLALAAVCASLSSLAHAFVGVPVCGHPGELDVNAVVTAERGKTEPIENPASFTKIRSWYEYELGVGYTEALRLRCPGDSGLLPGAAGG